jgi:urease accessory protein
MTGSGAAAALLMLADSRLPAGGHAHSGGVEAAFDTGLIQHLGELAGFLRGRLWTAGLTAAGLAAAAAQLAAGQPSIGDWARLDAEADARIPAPAQRAASRQQGRALLRAGRAAWPDDRLAAVATLTGGTAGTATGTATGDGGGGPHHPVALGTVAVAAGGDPAGAALVAGYLAVSGPASAAIRLRGFDPLAVHGVLAGLAGEIAAVAARAEAAAGGPLADLPCPAAPRLDLLAELHARSEVRLFAS